MPIDTDELSLVAQIEDLLHLKPHSLKNDPLALAKIGSLDRYLLRSCCNKRMLNTLSAMLRGAGVLDTEANVYTQSFTADAAVKNEDLSYVYTNLSILPSPLAHKPVLTKLSTELFELNSIETIGKFQSLDDSDYDADSLMEYDYLKIASFSPEEAERLEYDNFQLAGAVSQLQEQHHGIAENLKSSQAKIKTLEEQNKRDLEYLRKVGHSGDSIRDKVCELKSEITELGHVLAKMKAKTDTKSFSALISAHEDHISSTPEPVVPHQKAPLPVLMPIPETPKKEESLQSAPQVETLRQEPEEPKNQLRFFINSTIFILLVACWL